MQSNTLQGASLLVQFIIINNRIHTIINIGKSHFEILITVYLKNIWCLVYAILHQSIVIHMVFSVMAC